MSALEEWDENWGPPYNMETDPLLEIALSTVLAVGLWKNAKAMRDELLAENERLKVCGNCEHMRAEEFCRCNHPDLDTWDEQHYVCPSDHCEFTPSRWRPREEATDGDT